VRLFLLGALSCLLGCSSAERTDGSGEAQALDTPVLASIANLGDSISQGYDADDSQPLDVEAILHHPGTVFADAVSLSWVQGTDPRVGSVASFYRQQNPSLRVTAVSRSGSEMVRHLEQQARALQALHVDPELVHVLLGGNDVCNRPVSTTDDATATMYSVAQWSQAVDRGLSVLAATVKPGGTVRVLSMPRVDLLYEAVESATVPVIVPSPVGPPALGTGSCGDLWSVAASAGYAICPIVTREASAERRHAIGRRIDAYNDALAAAVARFDSANSGVHFVTDWHGALGAGGTENGSIGTYIYRPEEVSKKDCFHPSIRGQATMASFVLNRAVWTSKSVVDPD
jgi:lysophospholipase L1-like esterase